MNFCHAMRVRDEEAVVALPRHRSQAPWLFTWLRIRKVVQS